MGKEAALKRDVPSLLKEGNELLSNFSADRKSLEQSMRRLAEWKLNVWNRADRSAMLGSERREFEMLGSRINCLLGAGKALLELRQLDTKVVLGADGAAELIARYSALFREVAVVSLLAQGVPHEDVALLPREFTADDVRKVAGSGRRAEQALAILGKGDLLADSGSLRSILGEKFAGELARFAKEYEFLLFAGELSERLKGGEPLTLKEGEGALAKIRGMKESESGFISAYAFFLENKLELLSSLTRVHRESCRARVLESLDSALSVAGRHLKKGGESIELARSLNYMFMELNETAALPRLAKIVDTLMRYSAQNAALFVSSERGGDEGERGAGMMLGIGPGGLSLSKSFGPLGNVFLGTGGLGASLGGFNLLTGAFDPVSAALSVVNFIGYLKGKKKRRRQLNEWVDSERGIERAGRMAYAKGIKNLDWLLMQINHPEEAAKANRNFDPSAPVYDVADFGLVVPTEAASYLLIAKHNPEKRIGGEKQGEAERRQLGEIDAAVARLEQLDSAVGSLINEPVEAFRKVKEEFERLKEAGFSPRNMARIIEYLKSDALKGVLDVSFEGGRINISDVGEKGKALPVVFGKDFESLIADAAAIWALSNVQRAANAAMANGDFQSALLSVSLLDYFLAEGSVSPDVREALEGYKSRIIRGIKARGEMAEKLGGKLGVKPAKLSQKEGGEIAAFFSEKKRAEEQADFAGW